MAEKPATSSELLPQLFRREYTKMTAVLCRHFGLDHLEAAEDIVSETFLKASENWSLKGSPENPAAWLYAVARNKARDYLKRRKVFDRIKTALQVDERQDEPQLDFSEQTISDSHLAMIFAVCNPVNGKEAQICLALQILCGFSVEEIAGAFLAKIETIKKRLQRARANLRRDQFQIRPLQDIAITSRLDAVLRTLYLLFNEGYFSRSGNQLIRKDLCSEAMRLAFILTENPLTDTPSAKALLALMCYQSSRLDARATDAGEAILFEEQDRTLWNRELMEKGHYYLVNACLGNEISKYHLEAGIAYWHTAPVAGDKWTYILQLYNQLILIEYTPMIALNRTFAFAKVKGHCQAIEEAEKLNLHHISHYYALLGYLYADTEPAKAAALYRKAISISRSVSEKQTLLKEIERIDKPSGHS